MAKKNRVCIVCGKEYEYCGNCSAHRNLETWHTIYHDSNCREVFNITSEYMTKMITKEEARKKYGKCDLSNKENFQKVILSAINEVCSYKKEKNVEKVAEKIVEKAVEKTTEEIVEVKEEVFEQ